KESTVHFGRNSGQLADGFQHFLPSIAGDAVEDPAVLDRRTQARAFLLGCVGAKEIRGDAVLVQGCPFLELDAIESILVVDAMARQGALADPPIDRLLRYVEQPGNVANAKVHEFLEPGLRRKRTVS